MCERSEINKQPDVEATGQVGNVEEIRACPSTRFEVGPIFSGAPSGKKSVFQHTNRPAESRLIDVA